MSRKITLFASDYTTPLGNVLLASDYPSDPGLLIWHARCFIAGNIAYGAGAPGAYESYLETPAQTISDAQVAPADVVPTVVSG